ncbi:MAG: AtpZ/AtpI family protein [Sphingomicrobium sp.]
MAEDENGEVPKLPPDARLESLDERLERLQEAEAKRNARKQGNADNRAGRLVVSQLVGGPVGGAMVGWVLDQWLGTAPWLLLGLMFIGFAGGFISVMRISGRSTGNRTDEPR